MLSSRFSIRALHIYSRLLQVQDPNIVAPVVTKIYKGGKKKPPKKQDLVILNARESRIFRRDEGIHSKLPGYYVLDPSELEDSRKKLVQFTTEVTLEQTISSIQHIKPEVTKVSANRYQQIKEDISEAYSNAQLREFLAKYYPSTTGYRSANKTKLISKIMDSCWKLEKSYEINAAQDLLIQRTFDLSPMQIFVVLTQNTIEQWLRANVQVILLPSERQMIVRANAPQVQYIELALTRVLGNMETAEIDMGEIKKIYTKQHEKLPMEEIQRLSGVFMQERSNDSESLLPLNDESEISTTSKYTMHTLGKKRFSLAKRLMLWALDFNPFVASYMHTDLTNPVNKWYKSIFNETLPWIHRNKSWLRLKQPKIIGPESNTPETPTPIIDYEKVYSELNTPATKNKPLTENVETVTAVSFGNLLYQEQTLKDANPKTFFQSTLPHIREKIMEFDSYIEPEDGIEELVDRHEYHAQIKFVPSPFNNSENYLNHSPIEFWLEIDENQKGDVSTLQVLRIVNEQNTYVSLPSEFCDLKFVKSESERLVDPYSGAEDWLSEQPGIKNFLEKSSFEFGTGKNGLKIADYVEIKLPGTDTVVRYEYVSMSYRKELLMKYNERLLQFTVVEGGALGGRINEALLVGKVGEDGKVEELTLDEFKEFADDSVKFVKNLKL